MSEAGFLLALDAGTTGVTALVVSAHGAIVARGYQEFAQHFPRPGWVEHSPEEIWQAALEATRAALEAWDGDRATLRGVGITNQRETVLLWDRETLGSPRRAIVWQDRRTAAICERLRAAGHEARVAELTGLRLDPYFSGTKLVWLQENEPHTWALVEDGRYAVGTVDSYLVTRMTRGTWHLTDVSNACRTLLFDLAEGAWSDELVTPQDSVRISASPAGGAGSDRLLASGAAHDPSRAARIRAMRAYPIARGLPTGARVTTGASSTATWPPSGGFRVVWVDPRRALPTGAARTDRRTH
jgi:glycerol kinase